jgi:hypothetical protein
MRYPLLLLAATAWWIGIVAAQAQTTTTPGMGPTSPLGAPSANNSSLGSNSSNLGGIPLGSTEINTPGVSPLIMPCPNASSNSAFDGGGSTLSNNCGSTASNNNGSGAASMSGAGGTVSGPNGPAIGSNIPLGATDLGIPGESQTTAVPSVTPCLQSVAPSQESSTGSGLTPATVNGGC